MNLLEISHMKKSFDGVPVIENISLSVREGEVLSVIGPSGSGKSTLLRCATLLETMDSGELRIGGRCAAREEGGRSVYAPAQELRLIRRELGLVFQSFHLFPHYSVKKNIVEPQRIAGRSREEAERKADELMESLGLSDHAAKYPCQLSGGQQQRVSIARALALDPKILFFDEPTSALDPELTAEVLRVIRALAGKRMTMVIVTHEMEFARELSDRIVFMENGYIQEEGTPEELFSTENARVRSFIGRLRA
ncbi:amino acid ABC transporter ATP-binding protein [Lachnoclostridium sp. Marseille-P6806]|uniref:amino acid ABC transporter ATP-binding protein n=1 Tax=Lachnoclostridium sp. Marseille-P6806 TaxID=2364793 RepID=UPI00103169A1|nr:amino acid ABC transporter ATP-binding protein [Lachnoclostridium sp. Marseille-P6806]